jgi:ATP-dependent Clp protease ATP-binding subunit ClpA
LAKFNKPGWELSVLLFDEIEKASDALWQLMLGILDKATLTLGDNRVVNFSKVIIIMTSNLGGADMQRVMHGGFGFRGTEAVRVDDAKNSDIATQAAKRHFTPEFMNRINNLVVFNTLTKEHIRQIMHIELGEIQRVMFDRAKFVYQVTDTAKEVIMEEGYDEVYGARNLKRTLEARIRLPLARLVSSGQIAPGSCVVVDQIGKAEQFEFSIQKLAQTQVKFTDTTEDIL